MPIMNKEQETQLKTRLMRILTPNQLTQARRAAEKKFQDKYGEAAYMKLVESIWTKAGHQKSIMNRIIDEELKSENVMTLREHEPQQEAI